jgi:hypothetical protein
MAISEALTRICLEGLRNTTQNISQDSRSSDRDLKLGLPNAEQNLLTEVLLFYF